VTNARTYNERTMETRTSLKRNNRLSLNSVERTIYQQGLCNSYESV